MMVVILVRLKWDPSVVTKITLMLFQVTLELGHEAVLYVKDALTGLADRVLVLFARDLVVHRSLTQSHPVQRPRSGQSLQRPVDRAS